MREIRALLAKLVQVLNAHGPHLPVYWGNRNWHPMLTDVVLQMADDGIRHALAFVTSAFGSYSSCRQYREDIARAREEVGAEAPHIDVLRRFYNHPGFIASVVDRIRAALDEFPADRRENAALVFSAHSIPVAMAKAGPYEAQLREACRLVAEAVPHRPWELAFQSRSGPPVSTVAGTQHRDRRAGDCRERRCPRTGDRADRVPARTHRGCFRPRRRGSRALRRTGSRDGPRGNTGAPRAVCRDDPPVGPRADNSRNPALGSRAGWAATGRPVAAGVPGRVPPNGKIRNPKQIQRNKARMTKTFLDFRI